MSHACENCKEIIMAKTPPYFKKDVSLSSGCPEPGIRFKLVVYCGQQECFKKLGGTKRSLKK